MHKVVDQYNALKLNKYQEIYEIVTGNVDENGKFWMNWAIASEYDSSVGHGVPVKKDDDSYRNLPIKIVLGDKEQAIENLKWLLSELTGTDSPEGLSEPASENDVPF